MAGLLAVVLLGGLVLLVADYLGLVTPAGVVERVQAHPYVSGVAIVGVEEAGIPLPFPGDVVIMYSGHTVPRGWGSWAVLWFGFLVAVLCGTSVLYLVGGRWGRRLARGRLGAAVHLTPERLKAVEGYFGKWGFWTVLLGRHVPGGRQPLTVAAGVFGVPYPTFMLSVAISSGVWIAAFMFVGIQFGPKAAEILHAHRVFTFVLPVLLAASTAYILFRVLTVRGHGKKKG